MILNTLEKEYLKVGDIKKNYGGIVLSTCFSLGYLMIYQLGYEAVFFNAVMIPAAFITLHASVRTRKNIRDMTTALGFRYQTPMGYILQGLGVSLSWMGLGVHSFQHPDWNIDPAKAYACLVQ